MKNSRSKLPWCQAYPADHLADPQLSRCSPATRGIWVDWCCHMHRDGQSGEVVGMIIELARLGRCDIAEAEAAIDELERTGAADVFRVTSNGSETGEYRIRNRRMHRAATARKSNADRQKRHRQRQSDGESNANVADESRDRGQRLDINTTPVQGSIRGENEFSAEWAAVVVVVRECGVAEAEAACAEARSHGVSPAAVHGICTEFRSKPGAWGAGLLHRVISTAQPGVPVAWPKPSAEYLESQRREGLASRSEAWREGVARQERERKERQAANEAADKEAAESGRDPLLDFLAGIRGKDIATNGAPH